MLAYLAIALFALLGLTFMIIVISRALADCPEKGPRAKAVGITVATGFLAIGGGAVLLIAAFATLYPDDSVNVFSMGLACLVLGLGFTQAVTTLRAALAELPKPPREAEPVASPVPMEPVLT